MLPINYHFPTNLPQPWNVCSYIFELHKWTTDKNLDTESMMILCSMLIDLKRPFKIQSSLGSIIECKIGINIDSFLNLFSNTLSVPKKKESDHV